MSALLLAQQILNGLLDGVYYLLIALGLSLIFSLGGIVNLAHGAFYAIGAYLTLVLSPYIGFGGSFIAAPVVVALLGMVIERTLFRRFYRSDPILSLLMTFGLAMVAEQALRMIFGAPPLSFSIPPWLRGQVAVGSFIYSFYRVVLLGIAATCIAGLWLLLQKTSFGRVVRAGVQNPDMVGALGISLQPYMSAVAALGIGLAGLAGVLLAPIYSIHPAMGQEIITPAFVVVVIGGLGSFWGVVAAALLVGLRQRASWSASAIPPLHRGDLSIECCLCCCSGRAACSANASRGSSKAGHVKTPACSPADCRPRASGTTLSVAGARPDHDVGLRSRDLCHRLHGAEHPGRAYRPGVVRARRLVRPCRLRPPRSCSATGCTIPFSVRPLQVS
jgi:branched-chain amino acid transport system permease protein